jgi:hypothetical protein
MLGETPPLWLDRPTVGGFFDVQFEHRVEREIA